MYFHFNAKGYFNVYILSDCPPLSHRHEQTTQLQRLWYTNKMSFYVKITYANCIKAENKGFLYHKIAHIQYWNLWKNIWMCNVLNLKHIYLGTFTFFDITQRTKTTQNRIVCPWLTSFSQWDKKCVNYWAFSDFW